MKTSLTESQTRKALKILQFAAVCLVPTFGLKLHPPQDGTFPTVPPGLINVILVLRVLFFRTKLLLQT